LKKVQGKKKRDAAEADAKKALEQGEGFAEERSTGEAVPNFLQEKDEDVIF